MAQAKTNPTRNNDPSNWLSIDKDVFPRWRDRLGSKEAASELKALLRDVETRSAKHRVKPSGEEIPRTSNFVDTSFWRDRDRLLLRPDADGGDDHLEVDCTDHADVYLPNGRWESFVRRIDVERHERLYFPMTMASPPAPSKEKAKPGPKPDFEWELIEAECYELMDDNGDFMPDDPEWDCQARLEKALMNFCQDTWAREPGPSTLRDKLPDWLSAWRKRKTGEA